MAPRPRKWRHCRPHSGCSFYKPQGMPMAGLEIVELAQDELEAIRHCDFEDQEQEAAAKEMKISRGTVQRLLYSGRKKIADAMLHGKAIKIIGIDYVIPPPQAFGVGRCGRGFRHRHQRG